MKMSWTELKCKFSNLSTIHLLDVKSKLIELLPKKKGTLRHPFHFNNYS